MSYDSPAAQKAFREGQNFEFRLIPDTTHEMSEAWQAARPPDHQYKDWPRRITYLVDPDGTIAGAWEVKDVRAHPAEVLELLLSKTGEAA